MLHLINDPASADPQPFDARTRELARLLDVDLEPRPVVCWGVNLCTFCPCGECSARRDAVAQRREDCELCCGDETACSGGSGCCAYDFRTWGRAEGHQPWEVKAA